MVGHLVVERQVGLLVVALQEQRRDLPLRRQLVGEEAHKHYQHDHVEGDHGRHELVQGLEAEYLRGIGLALAFLQLGEQLNRLSRDQDQHEHGLRAHGERVMVPSLVRLHGEQRDQVHDRDEQSAEQPAVLVVARNELHEANDDQALEEEQGLPPEVVGLVFLVQEGGGTEEASPSSGPKGGTNGQKHSKEQKRHRDRPHGDKNPRKSLDLRVLVAVGRLRSLDVGALDGEVRAQEALILWWVCRRVVGVLGAAPSSEDARGRGRDDAEAEEEHQRERVEHALQQHLRRAAGVRVRLVLPRRRPTVPASGRSAASEAEQEDAEEQNEGPDAKKQQPSLVSAWETRARDDEAGPLKLEEVEVGSPFEVRGRQMDVVHRGDDDHALHEGNVELQLRYQR
mmetsp:Transcript_27284/g.46716  ORF Transcript_27284/g.46716 Transcript_27284/m.46716 type:complete len:397 (+) Transcript_27284:1811-3001(+)